MGVTSNAAIWYTARAAGIVTLLLLSATVTLGLVLAARPSLRRWPRFALEDVHRFLSMLVLVFGGLHVLSIAADTYVPFSLGDLLVPFAAGYRPVWTGLGVASAELLLALSVTNWLRTRLPYRIWRGAHVLAFPIWGLAVIHGAVGGTDRGEPWLVALVLASVGAVGAAAMLRLGRPASPADASRRRTREVGVTSR